MKGQAWAEYIIILSVVVIIAGVAMYIAGAFPGTSRQVEERDSAAYWLTADVGIIRYNVNSSTAQLVIKNNRNFKITVTNITSRGVGVLVADGGGSVTIEPGRTAQVNVVGLGCSLNQYSLPLTVSYIDVKYGTEYSIYGEKPLVGSCMGPAALSPLPECSSNSECGTNSTSCDIYCSGIQLCSYPYNPATCQRACTGGRCQDCTPSCGSANCTSCGSGQLCCSVACKTLACANSSQCNDGNSCTRDNCSNSGTCNAACSHVIITSCASGDGCCPAGCNYSSDRDCLCGNGACGAGETYLNCPQDCCRNVCTNRTDAVTCHSECNNYAGCTNFRPVCNNQARNAQRCSNAFGNAGNTHYTRCCNGAITACPAGRVCVQRTPTTTRCTVAPV